MNITGTHPPHNSRRWLTETPPGWSWGDPLSLSMQMIVEKVFTRDITEDLSITALRGGTFAFEFSANNPASAQSDDLDEQLRAISDQLKLINAFSLCLHSSMLEAQQTHLEAYHTSKSNMLIFEPGRQGSPITISSQDLYTFPRTTEDLHQIGMHYPPDPITADTLTLASEKLSELQGLEELAAIKQASQLNSALCAYQDHDFSTAVSLSWALIEKHLSEIWLNHILTTREKNTNEPAENKEKKRVRQANISSTMQMLSITGLASTSHLNEIEHVRKSRNAIIHRLEEPSRETAELSIRLGADSLKSSLGVNFPIATALSSPVLFSKDDG